MNRKRLTKLTRNQFRWMQYMAERFGTARPATVTRKQLLDAHADVITERGDDKGLKYPCWITESAYMSDSRGVYRLPWDLYDVAVADGRFNLDGPIVTGMPVAPVGA